MPTIEELLHRRSDLSTFIVHFTRSTESGSSYENLLNILQGWIIEARTTFGMAKQLAERHLEIEDSQKVVCFTETPLEHAWMMCSDIEGRTVQFDGYGLAFTKTYARKTGANPVWYLDITPRLGRDWLTVAVANLVQQAEVVSPGQSLRDAEILKLTPFIEQMGNPSGVRKEFWWEREWRFVGDFPCPPHKIVVVFAPESVHDQLRTDLRSVPDSDRFPHRVVDATWGLERMIGELSGAQDLGPFPR